MGIFSNESTYDRARILEAASRARARKRYRKATALYRRVLAMEPGNLELHARLAPLLAATRQPFDSWVSFETCGRGALSEKRLEQAVNIYREAARCLPLEIRAWQSLAGIERQRGHDREAADALVEGRKHFRRRRHRPEAIALLRRALEIDPARSELVLDLARLLSRSHQESEAHMLLHRLAGQSSGVALRKVRAAQWRIAPTLVNSWRWIHAACTAGREPDTQRPRSVHARS